MNLTNKQLTLVVDMIYTRVSKEDLALIKKEKEQEAKFITKIVTDATLSKQVAKAFAACKAISSISIKELEITKEFKFFNSAQNYYCGNYTHTFQSYADFVKLITNKYVDFKVRKPIERKEIENRVILSMVDNKDLNSLIENIVSSFIL